MIGPDPTSALTPQRVQLSPSRNNSLIFIAQIQYYKCSQFYSERRADRDKDANIYIIEITV